MQDLWIITKEQNLHIFGVEEDTEVQTKGAENLYITAENIPNLGENMDIEIYEAFRTQIEKPPHTIY